MGNIMHSTAIPAWFYSVKEIILALCQYIIVAKDLGEESGKVFSLETWDLNYRYGKGECSALLYFFSMSR